MKEYNTKSELIADFKQHDKDTGSVKLQVALLTNRINSLTKHLKANPKDFGSKRGLIMLVGQRRRSLKYIEKHNSMEYKELIESLELRK